MDALSEPRGLAGYGAIAALRKAQATVCAGVLALVFLATAAPAQQVIIAALGDSLTQGYGLPPDDGFVPQMQTWLAERGHEVTVINAGVSGDTTAGGLSRVDWTLTPDVDAMIVALGGNDLLRGIDPAVSRANLSGILQKAQTADVAVLLIGLEAPGNYGPDFKAAFEAMYPELAAEYGALHAANFLGAFTAVEDRATAMTTLMQPDGIHPSAAGVALIVDALGPFVEDLIALSGDG